MDEAEKEGSRDKGRAAGHQGFGWKLEHALLWGFFGAAIGGGLLISLLNLPEITVLIPGAAAGWYGWHRKSKTWW